VLGSHELLGPNVSPLHGSQNQNHYFLNNGSKNLIKLQLFMQAINLTKPAHDSITKTAICTLEAQTQTVKFLKNGSMVGHLLLDSNNLKLLTI
jgi:hypothetical protein